MGNFFKSPLQKFYGKTDETSVSQVKEIFKDLDLEGEYKKFEEAKYETIMSDINNLNFSSSNISSNQTERIKSILMMYAKKIFKRNK